ncbi:hypothetical protein [Pseudarthrobacter sp. H2]|uniref:hypothetical protein n=1 Tax=Pseudarthrobacter sp. H2 TaxID=3418415 RepID=UPI003CEFF6FA
MEQEINESQPSKRVKLNYEAIAAGLTEKDLAKIAGFQKSVFPGLVESLGRQATYASTLRATSLAASKFMDSQMAAGLAADIARQQLTSPALAAITEHIIGQNKELNGFASRMQELTSEIVRSNRVAEMMTAHMQPAVTQAARIAEQQYKLNSALAPLLANVVNTIKSSLPTSQISMPANDWSMLLADVEELKEEADADEEEIEEFLQNHPELQAELDELTQLIDFTDPVQRARIVRAMKLLTYLMFFAVIVGSWQLLAAYASIISLMGMTAPNVVKAVGSGTEKVLNKISPLPDEEPKE